MKWRLFCLICFIVLLSAPLTGCKHDEPVEIIRVFRAQPNAPQPTGAWGLPSVKVDPHPEWIQRVFRTGDKMYIGLRISNQIKTNIIFTRFTYFNEGTSMEVDVGSPNDLMKVWEPGQIDLLAFKNPWSVPNELGDYQLRIYFDNNVVASARFQVK